MFDSVKDKLSLGFENMGPQNVKNIAEPIRAYRVLLDPAQTGRIVGARAGRPRWLVPAMAALLAVLAAAGGLILWQPWAPNADSAAVEKAARPDPAQASIAVLPFTNMSGDKEQEYFSDGMTEDLITDLSKVSGLLVIARNSVFTFKDKAVPIAEVARMLGVRYVLEGSVRKSGDRVRINAQLIDATTGFHLWADRFDRHLENVFALQDEVIGKIVSVLKVTLTSQEREALTHRYTKNTEAYDLFLRGLHFVNRFTKRDRLAARAYFEKAIELDPNFARAYSNLSGTYARSFIRDGNASNDDLEKAYYLATKAVALDPSLPQAYFSLAFVQRLRKKLADAAASAEKAIKLNPNYADGYSLLANTLAYAGTPERSISLVHEALQLSPHAPAIHLMALGQSYFVLGRYEEAIRTLKRSIQYNPGAGPIHYWLAASYAQTVRIEDARWEIDEARALNPAITLRLLHKTLPFQRDSDREKFIDALRKAGMPEG